MNENSSKIPTKKIKWKFWYCIRDRPFNLKGGLWFFVSFRIFFLGKHELEYLFFLSRKAEFFFPEFNIRLYDKNSESDYFFSLHQNQNIFFSNIGNQNIFLEKKHNLPLQVKWSFPYTIVNVAYIRRFASRKKSSYFDLFIDQRFLMWCRSVLFVIPF